MTSMIESAVRLAETGLLLANQVLGIGHIRPTIDLSAPSNQPESSHSWQAEEPLQCADVKIESWVSVPGPRPGTISAVPYIREYPDNCVVIVTDRFQSASVEGTQNFVRLTVYSKERANTFPYTLACSYSHSFFPWSPNFPPLSVDVRDQCGNFYRDGFPVQVMNQGTLRVPTLVATGNQLIFPVADYFSDEIQWNLPGSSAHLPGVTEMTDRIKVGLQEELSGDLTFVELEAQNFALALSGSAVQELLDPHLPTMTPESTPTSTPPPTFTAEPTANLNFDFEQPKEALNNGYDITQEPIPPTDHVTMTITVTGNERLTFHRFTNPGTSHAELRELLYNPLADPKDTQKVIDDLDWDNDWYWWYKIKNGIAHWLDRWGPYGKYYYPEVTPQKLHNTQLEVKILNTQVLKSTTPVSTHTTVRVFALDQATNDFGYFELDKYWLDNIRLYAKDAAGQTIATTSDQLVAQLHLLLNNPLLTEAGKTANGIYVMPQGYTHAFKGQPYVRVEEVIERIHRIEPRVNQVILIDSEGDFHATYTDTTGMIHPVFIPTGTYLSHTYLYTDPLTGIKYYIGKMTHNFPFPYELDPVDTEFDNQTRSILGSELVGRELTFAVPLHLAGVLDFNNLFFPDEVDTRPILNTPIPQTPTPTATPLSSIKQNSVAQLSQVSQPYNIYSHWHFRRNQAFRTNQRANRQ